MSVDAIIAYARMIEEEKTYIVSAYATTNPVVVSQITGLSLEELEEMAEKHRQIQDTIQKRLGFRNTDNPIIYVGFTNLEREEELFDGETHCKYVGDYMELSECVTRITREINKHFKPKPTYREVENIRSHIMKEFVIPMTEAVTYDDKEEIFELQSRFLEFYQGAPFQNQARKICELVKKGKDFKAICDHVDVLIATQQENYGEAARIKKSLDNRARSVYK